MKRDIHFSKEEITMLLLISLYRVENTFNFNPIYFQHLVKEVKEQNPCLYTKFESELGHFDKPIENYLQKLIDRHYLEMKSPQSYVITMRLGQASVLTSNTSYKVRPLYQAVLGLKNSIDNLDISYLENALDKDYSLIMTCEDFLMSFFAKLLSTGTSTFNDDIFKMAFDVSLFDDKNMALFLKEKFSHDFEEEPMLPLVSKVIGLEEKFIHDEFFIGTTPQSAKMNDILENDNNIIMDKLVRKYTNKKKTIQNNPSVVK